MRAMLKSYLSFGLVTIPVKVYAATEDQSAHFNQLHKDCNTRIQYQKYCPTCEKAVEQDAIVKGYPLGNSEYVVLSEQELQKFEADRGDGVEIVAFVRAEEIDSLYYDKPYFLEPADVGHKAYNLLRTTLEQTNKVAMARFVMRSKENLAIVRAQGKGMVLHLIHWPTEVRNMETLTGLSVETPIKEQELAMAKGLVEQMTVAFDPTTFTNKTEAALCAYIEEKVSAKEITQVNNGDNGAKVIDLMEALKASLERFGTAEKPKQKSTRRMKKGA